MRRSNLSYANVIATLALFIALGGVSYAAINLPAGSVGTKQLKSNAVVSGKVKNRSLLGRDFKAGQLPRGAQGATGPTGPAGTPATRLWAAVTSNGIITNSSSPAITAQPYPPETSDYSVKFGQDVSDCVATATISGVEGDSGEILLIRDGTVAPDEIYVDTRTSSGSDTGGTRAFALAVFC